MPRLLRTLALLLLLPCASIGVAALSNGRVDAPTAHHQSLLRRDPPPPLGRPVSLRLVTWNVADGYGFTNNRAVRMGAVARTLARLDPDVVGLQEAFVARDRELLEAELRRAGSRLVHAVRFPGATVGNGLWILSAHPIAEAWFHRFEHSGRWYRLWEGDWWAGKGVGLARIRLPEGGFVDFFDTHAQAGRGNPENEDVRLGQMAELARFVREARLPGTPAFVVGDFNTRPGAPDYALAVREAELVRAMSLPSEIDHIFAAADARLRYEVLSSEVVAGSVRSPRPEVFLDRAPGPRELLAMLFGPPGRTRLSDHPGYLTQVRITPN